MDGVRACVRARCVYAVFLFLFFEEKQGGVHDDTVQGSMFYTYLGFFSLCGVLAKCCYQCQVLVPGNI